MADLNEQILKNSGKCKSCKAEVIWILTYRGNSMPVDAVPEKRYTLLPGLAGSPIGSIVDTYSSHFATCPDAESWRKK